MPVSRLRSRSAIYISKNDIMEVRFKQKSKIIDIAIVYLGVFVSVGIMLYGVFHFGLKEAWQELILNLFYIACLVMIVMYFFQKGITTNQFNYWCSLCVGVTVLLRDILFPPPITSYPLHLACLTLSVMLLQMLTYFYARKDWKSYSKANLWAICGVDILIATLYQIDIMWYESLDEYTNYMLTEIWIRPTITYGLVACFVTEAKES